MLHGILELCKSLEKLSNQRRQVHFLRAKLVHFYILTASRCQFTYLSGKYHTLGQHETKYEEQSNIISSISRDRNNMFGISLPRPRQLTSGYLDTTFGEIIIFTTFTTCFTKVSMPPSAVFPSSLAMFISQRASGWFNSVPKTITVSHE